MCSCNSRIEIRRKMTEEKFDLSKKAIGKDIIAMKKEEVYYQSDVKEFIRLLKEEDIDNLAEWLHNTYEKLSKKDKWKTQRRCRVKFNELPKENQQVMRDLALNICIRFSNKIDKLAGSKLTGEKLK